ncbi:MAG TPA: 3-oxoacyl-[acyl-carrier-protein] synthase III C-terminal domain-containing protein [Pseudonocardiaceae bacterium]
MFFGTTTGSELHRGSSNCLMDMVTDRNEYFAADIAAAERSGTASLIAATGAVSTGMVTRAVVVGADVMSRHTAPGDLRESYEGAGAAACLIGTDPILELQDAASVNSNFPAFGRPEDERFTRALMPIDSGTTALGLLRHTKAAVQLFLKKSGASLDDFDAFVLPQAFPAQALMVAKAVGIPLPKIAASIFAGEIGDTGAASVLIGLAKVLECIGPRKRILVCSYGSNAGADVLAFQTTDSIVEYQDRVRGEVDRLIQHKIEVEYAEALRLEHKLASPNITLGAFN